LIQANLITKSLRAFQGNGAGDGNLLAIVNVLAGDGNGSIYRLWKNLNRDITIISIAVANTSLTTGTSYGLGLYTADLSTVAYTAVAYFSGAMNLVTAHASLGAGTALDGMAGLTVAAAGPSGQAGSIWTNRLFEHAGFLTGAQPSPPDAYDFCMTATTASTVNGTVLVAMTYVMD
jgi:hypothetical protein